MNNIRERLPELVIALQVHKAEEAAKKPP